MAPIAPNGSKQPGSNLPAPYRSPWLALGVDLLAVAADLRLRCRELWRLNRSGDLPYPQIWPASLAASFWPIVLALVIGLLGAGLWRLARPGASPAPAPPGLISPGALPAADPGLAPSGAAPQIRAQAKPELHPPQLHPPQLHSPQLHSEVPSEVQAQALPRSRLPGSPGAQRTAPDPSPGPGASPGSAGTGSPAASGPFDLQPPQGDGPLEVDESPRDPNPLSSWRQRPEAAGLLLWAQGDAGAAWIQLVLSDAFGQLKATEQQQRADLWLVWAQEWGYDHLELRDQGGDLLGREARVGGGMILGFSP
ncbi:MAG: hypothetical protein NTZ53_05205 [Cyanobacteria bacterium]|nr:hypothetical protein [Cyanobacteriota bacterium]